MRVDGNKLILGEEDKHRLVHAQFLLNEIWIRILESGDEALQDRWDGGEYGGAAAVELLGRLVEQGEIEFDPELPPVRRGY